MTVLFITEHQNHGIKYRELTAAGLAVQSSELRREADIGKIHLILSTFMDANKLPKIKGAYSVQEINPYILPQKIGTDQHRAR